VRQKASPAGLICCSHQDHHR